jgi:hypothetical protein
MLFGIGGQIASPGARARIRPLAVTVSQSVDELLLLAAGLCATAVLRGCLWLAAMVEPELPECKVDDVSHHFTRPRPSSV